MGPDRSSSHVLGVFEIPIIKPPFSLQEVVVSEKDISSLVRCAVINTELSDLSTILSVKPTYHVYHRCRY